MKIATAAVSFLFFLATSAAAQTVPFLPRAKSHSGAKVFFKNLKDGQRVASPVTVQFGSEGIEIDVAGEVKENSGHFHLLIDQKQIPLPDQPLPFSDQVLHFGQAQTETSVNLSQGPHTLQILLAGGNHVPHDPPIFSKKIRVFVK